MNDNSLVVSNAANFMPALTQAEADQRYRQMIQFVKDQMVEGKDYGTIPGTPKPALYKPGAEKIITFFGYQVRFADDGSIERWDDEDPFFYYRRRAQLWRGDTLIAEASGSCNSKESRYRWRWVKPAALTPYQAENIDKWVSRGGVEGIWGFAYDKRETSGKYGKPEEYWAYIDECLENGTATRKEKVQPWNGQKGVYIEFPSLEYRVPNEDIFSLTNTILKMAEKRALVAVALIGCNASEFFTQDMEDLAGVDPDRPGVVDAQFTEATHATRTTPVAPPSASTDADTIIANFVSELREGSIGGNDYLSLGKALDFDSGYVMEVKADYTTREKDEKGKMRDKTDFGAAGLFLIAKYREVNGEAEPAGVGR